MYTIKIEDFLSSFYSKLQSEYNSEPEDYHKILFDNYVDKGTQSQLQNKTLNHFCSNYCYPKGWKMGIQLFVNVYHEINISFCSVIDIREYVDFLVKDESFKNLVKAAFYIEQTIHPRD